MHNLSISVKLFGSTGWIPLRVERTGLRGTRPTKALPSGMTWVDFDEIVLKHIHSLYVEMVLTDPLADNQVSQRKVGDRMLARGMNHRVVRLCLPAAWKAMVWDGRLHHPGPAISRKEGSIPVCY